MQNYGPDIEQYLRLIEENTIVNRNYLKTVGLLSFIVNRDNTIEVGKIILNVCKKDDFKDERHKKNYLLKALNEQKLKKSN